MTIISSEVQRTLVKSPPELWSELSDPDALARHLGELGEIKITRIEPEKLVAWEAEGTTGTVAIKASGWGTKVTLTVQQQAPAPAVKKPGPDDTAGQEDAREALAGEEKAAEQEDAREALAGEEKAADPIAAQPVAETEPSAASAPNVGPAETVPAEPKPAPATEAARRAAAGWPDPHGQAPAIESDLRAAEADTPISGPAPWQLEESERAAAPESVEAEPPHETEPGESRRGFFARLFGSRRKRRVADSHPMPAAEEIREQPDADVGPDALAEAVAPEEPVEAIDCEPVALAEPEPNALAEAATPEKPIEAIDSEPVAPAEPEESAEAVADAGRTEPELTPDAEPTAESEDLAAELKAAEEIAAEQVEAVLTGVLDRLGAAHHRPFSRA